MSGSPVCDSTSFWNHGREGNQEVVLLPSFRLLGYFVHEVDEIESFVGAAVLETVEPYLCCSISETSEGVDIS